MSIYRYVKKIFYRLAYVIAIFTSMIAFYLWNFPQLGNTIDSVCTIMVSIKVHLMMMSVGVVLVR